jgi:Branched-chain amino acid transport protein (AzlD)
MNPDLLVMAILAGGATYAFRYGPTRLNLGRLPQTGALARFLAATGPAAIGTLFVASVLPMLHPVLRDPLPLLAGVAAVLAVWGWQRSVVAATLAGALAHGATFALVAG